jgi:hypothetical protein
MLGRATLAATVAGVLLIAGAGTGATLATWHARTRLALGSVRSGSIALTVNGVTTANLGTLGAMKPGESQTLSATLTNASPAGAKNLRMGVYVDSASTGTSAVDAALHVVDAGTDACSTTGQGVALNGYKGEPLVQSLAPQQSVTFCLSLLLPGNAAVPPAGLPATSLQLAFRGKYQSWSAAADAATQVALLPSPPAAPTGLSCSGDSKAVKLAWAKATDVTGYQVLLSGAVVGTAAADATSATVHPEKNTTTLLVLRANNAGGSADTTIAVQIQGNTVTCS